MLIVASTMRAATAVLKAAKEHEAKATDRSGRASGTVALESFSSHLFAPRSPSCPSSALSVVVRPERKAPEMKVRARGSHERCSEQEAANVRESARSALRPMYLCRNTLCGLRRHARSMVKSVPSSLLASSASGGGARSRASSRRVDLLKSSEEEKQRCAVQPSRLALWTYRRKPREMREDNTRCVTVAIQRRAREGEGLWVRVSSTRGERVAQFCSKAERGEVSRERPRGEGQEGERERTWKSHMTL